MDRVCVATSDSAAYYALVSRLKSAGLPFSSNLPPAEPDCSLVLTTLREAWEFRVKAMVLEELDQDPGIFKGQVVSRLRGGTDILLVGIDPGKRIGVAVFYGRVKLAFLTFGSVDGVCESVSAFAAKVPSDQILIRVGGGNRAMAFKITDSIRASVPAAALEIVNESGTSTGSPKMKGVQRDQVAAAKIAFRKGEAIRIGATRRRYQGLQ